MSLQEIYQDACAAKRRGMGIARRLTAKDAPLLAMRVWMDFGICTEGVKCVYLSYIGLYYFNTPPIVVETDRKQIKRSRRGGLSCLRKVAARARTLDIDTWLRHGGQGHVHVNRRHIDPTQSHKIKSHFRHF